MSKSYASISTTKELSVVEATIHRRLILRHLITRLVSHKQIRGKWGETTLWRYRLECRQTGRHVTYEGKFLGLIVGNPVVLTATIKSQSNRWNETVISHPVIHKEKELPMFT